jgi:hypothetical protein
MTQSGNKPATFWFVVQCSTSKFIQVVVVRGSNNNIYVDNMEDPLIHTVRTQKRGTKTTMLQTTRRLKRELQRGTRQITS